MQYTKQTDRCKLVSLFCNYFVTTFIKKVDILYTEESLILMNFKYERGNNMNTKILKVISIISILLILFISGCENDLLNKNDKAIYEALEGTIAAPTDDDSVKLIQKFRSIVESNNEPYTLVQFIDENIKETTGDKATAMVILLEEAQKKHIQKYTDELFIEDNQMELLKLSGTELFFAEENIENIQNLKLRELVERIINGKYRLINIEGGFYPIIDYEKLKEYNLYITEEMKEYINVKSFNSNRPVLLDGEITIPFNEIEERLVKTEKYIQKYPQGIKFEDALREYADYLRVYMEGAPNSPIYEYENNQIKDEVLNSYKHIAKDDTLMTSKIISRYLEIIEENENIIDESVLSKVPRLLSEAVAILENIK